VWPCGDATSRGCAAAGPLAALLAEQAERHAIDCGRTSLPGAFPALPEDLLNFQYDALACAVALAWPGVELREIPVELSFDGRLLRMRELGGAPPLRVAVDVDGKRFEDVWLDAVERAARARTP
jgi:hypothetical protein